MTAAAAKTATSPSTETAYERPMHYDVGEWTSYLNSELPENVEEAMTDHLDGCPACCKLLSRAADNDEAFVTIFGRPAGPPSLLMPPTVESLVDRLVSMVLGPRVEGDASDTAQLVLGRRIICGAEWPMEPELHSVVARFLNRMKRTLFSGRVRGRVFASTEPPARPASQGASGEACEIAILLDAPAYDRQDLQLWDAQPGQIVLLLGLREDWERAGFTCDFTLPIAPPELVATREAERDALLEAYVDQDVSIRAAILSTAAGCDLPRRFFGPLTSNLPAPFLPIQRPSRTADVWCSIRSGWLAYRAILDALQDERLKLLVRADLEVLLSRLKEHFPTCAFRDRFQMRWLKRFGQVWSGSLGMQD